MHWPTIRTIALRECRDLLRDRRTVLMIFLTPVFLYPVMGYGGYQFALHSKEQTAVIGLEGADHLPKADSPLPAAAWLSTGPRPLAPVAALALYNADVRALDYPPLLVDGRFPERYFDHPGDARSVRVELLPPGNRAALDSGQVDLIVVVPADFSAKLDAAEPTALEVYTRLNDEKSKFADLHWEVVFGRWKLLLKEQRFQRRGLRTDFDDPVGIRRPQHEGDEKQVLLQSLAYEVARYVPFILVMWALAGALHPAIDLTAGEKERGTLETLLLCPARRSEIVAGKFLAVWAFSTASAMWNLSGLAGFIVASRYLLDGFEVIRISGLFWGALFIVLLAALFSAVGLALGTYARSSKEGQYYLLPMFFVAMPLAFLAMAPGVELNWFFSLVPITGAALLLQKLLIVPLDQVPWWYVPMVLSSLMFWSGLALAWAVFQFHREAVLFREAEGFTFAASLRRLFGRKPV
jgi:sodium transport system permease protein